jgi:hypothetical protein
MLMRSSGEINKECKRNSPEEGERVQVEEVERRGRPNNKTRKRWILNRLQPGVLDRREQTKECE